MQTYNYSLLRYLSSLGPYPEPYLFTTFKSDIHVIDLLTIDKTVVFRRTEGFRSIVKRAPADIQRFGMDIDTVNMKLYFGDGNDIYRTNYDGTGVKVVLKNADVFRMVIDWIGRRLFWTEGQLKSRIFVAKLNGKEKRTLITTLNSAFGIAVDPTVGYVLLVS